MSESGVNVRDEFFESLLGDFLDESAQLLDRLNENLLNLDEWVRSLAGDHHQRCDEDLLNDMFRSAHSLKGLSAMLGLGDINQLTHRIENVFDAARKDELTITADAVELMFQGVDRLVSLVDALKDPGANPVECETVIAGISTLLQEAGAERKPTTQADAERALAGKNPDAPTSEDQPAGAGEEAAEPAADRDETSGVAPPTATLGPSLQPDVDHFAGITDESEAVDKYLSIFIDEAELSLDQLTETLLATEGQGGREAIEKLLVTSHRIKGSAASVGLNRAAKLAHLMEDLLQELRDAGRDLLPRVTDAMLKCSDGLRLYVLGLKQGNPLSDDFPALGSELLTAGAQAMPAADAPVQSPPGTNQPGPSTPAGGTPDADSPAASGITDELRTRVTADAPEGIPAYVGEVVFQANVPLVGLKAQLIYEKLAHLGKVVFISPPADQLEELESLERVTFGLASEESLAAIYQKVRIAGIERMAIEPLSIPGGASVAAAASAIAAPTKAGPTVTAGRTPAPATPAARPDSAAVKSRSAEAGSKPAETLRVDIDRLDQLMNLAGQLVINRARFTQIGDSLKQAVASKQSSHVLRSIFGTLDKMTAELNLRGDPVEMQTALAGLQSQARRVRADLETVRRDVEALGRIRGSVNDLMETVHQLDRVTDGIQQSVMDTRMVPIGPLFARFKRVVRDITRSNGKDIRLLINGEKTELDKRMIDELGDPLIHIVRNAADHGIEQPEVRQAAGKPRQGVIRLDAFHRGNSIIIQVADDGKGLSPEKILNKALERGIVTQADAEKMTGHQIYQLIWEPGLSTAEKVTEVSGRGMGMDIVRSKIEEINGTVELDSESGVGTTLTIKLPLTLAILPSLMAEIDGDVFAIPVEAVAEIVSVKREDLGTVHGLWTARVRGRVISVVQLGKLFTWNGSGSYGRDSGGEDTTLVILGDEGHEIGLEVDRLLGEEDVVIKSMAENFRNVVGIAGASILGDGRVSLILDAGALLDMSSNRIQNATTALS